MPEGFANITIRGRVLLLILGVSMLIGALGVQSFVSGINDADHIARHEALAISHTIAYDILSHEFPVGPAGFERGPEIERYILGVKRSLHRDIAIVDREETIVADAVVEEVGTKFMHDPADEVGQTLTDGSVRTFSEASIAYPGGIKLMVTPLKTRDGSIAGALVIEYTPLLNEVVDLKLDDARNSAIYYVLALGVALGAGIIFSESITKHMRFMERAVRGITEGDLGSRMTVGSLPAELGTLATSFNKMADQVQTARVGLLASSAALKEREARLLDAQRITHLGDWLWRVDGESVEWSDEVYRIHGLKPHSVAPTYSLVRDTMHPADLPVFSGAIEAALRDDAPFDFDYRLHRPDGSVRVVHTIGFVTRDADGRPLTMSGTVQDVTELRSAERSSAENERKLRTLFDSVNDAIFVLDSTGRFIDINTTAHARLGYDRQEMLSMHISELDPPEFAAKIPERIDSLKRRGYAVFDSAHRRKDGTVMPVEINSRTVDLGGETIIISVVRDITDRKLSEERMRANIEEKEILLREIHHRVKNNLAIIISLLRLQSRHIESPDAVEALRESQNRIRSMALIHEMLYRDGNFIKIDVREYVTVLVESLCATYRLGRSGLQLELEIENMPLGLDTLIPCGLIINELVTNSLKHAFGDQPSPMIEVRFGPHGDHALLLSVSDNGRGIRAEDTGAEGNSLGVQIVKSLSMQLKGEAAFPTDGGSTVNILFPNMRETL